MQKVYLLLRSNRQIGPHSAEELAGLNLQATDLVWIEGKSTAWVYPQEIAELLPLLKSGSPAAENTAPKQHEAYLPQAKKEDPPKEKKERHVFVSLPEKGRAPQPVKAAATAQSPEEKAAALKQRARAYAAPIPPSEDVAAQPAMPHTHTEDQYNAWAAAKQKQKKKKVLLHNGVAVAAVLILSAGGFVIAKNIFRSNEQASVNSSRIEQAPAPEIKGAEQTITPAPEPLPEALQTAGSISQPDYKEERRSIAPAAVRVKNTIVSAKEKEVSATTAAVKNSGPYPAETLPQGKKEEGITSAQPAGTTVSAPVKEKKTLSQKLNRFFDKLNPKKEEENPVAEGSSPKAQDEAGERQTRRRGDESAAANKPDLIQFIDISSNEAADKFMAGIHGLELTVRNRSNETVKSGAVEVRYYNDNKDLMDKRTVNFASIPPNKKITLKAPDHRLADHTDYKLITVN